MNYGNTIAEINRETKIAIVAIQLPKYIGVDMRCDGFEVFCNPIGLVSILSTSLSAEYCIK